MPQGSVLSPQLLFNIYIDDLLDRLTALGATVLAYADHILVASDSKLQLIDSINAIDNWSKENGININTNKSAILEIRLDQRTPNRL